MDKRLIETLQSVVKERAEFLGKPVKRESIDPLILKINDQISRTINMDLLDAAASCGSFSCPGGYSCDWH